jgi:cell division septum initiation protein DivIVA
MMATDLELDIEILKKEVSDMKEIHTRLDTAITKITEVSNCINRMLAVHEEKISQQEEATNRQQTDIDSNVKELHSRITSNQRELLERMTKQHRESDIEIRRLREDVVNRIGVLEKWKYLVIGGAIVIGFSINAYMRHFM